MDAELEKARLEGRTALARVPNPFPRPWSLTFAQTPSKLTNVPKVDRYAFEIHLATRRTTFNPREVMVLRLLLPKPFTQYPSDTGLTFFVNETSTYAPITTKLLPDTEENR